MGVDFGHKEVGGGGLSTQVAASSLAALSVCLSREIISSWESGENRAATVVHLHVQFTANQGSSVSTAVSCGRQK